MPPQSHRCQQARPRGRCCRRRTARRIGPGRRFGGHFQLRRCRPACCPAGSRHRCCGCRPTLPRWRTRDGLQRDCGCCDRQGCSKPVPERGQEALQPVGVGHLRDHHDKGDQEYRHGDNEDEQIPDDFGDRRQHYRVGTGAMCYKDSPGLLMASVVWPGHGEGPSVSSRAESRSPPDQHWPATKDCNALVPNLSTP
jgi:hypothetical protein